MAVLTIAELTLKEAVRRRTLFGALLMGLLVVGISLMLTRIQGRVQHQYDTGRMSLQQYAFTIPLVRTFVMSLCLSSIKSLGALFAALLAGGAISGEIESGLMAVVLPKPVYRWQILLGKWIGINIILVASTLIWTLLVWFSFNAQLNINVTGILRAGPFLALYPVILSTLTLTISTVAPRLLGTVLAVTLAALAWFDGIFNSLGRQYDVDLLRGAANFSSLIVPQGTISWWVERAMGSLLFKTPQPRGFVAQSSSPEFVREWGVAHLGLAHLDAVYVAAYIIVLFFAGAALFRRRDI